MSSYDQITQFLNHNLSIYRIGPVLRGFSRERTTRNKMKSKTCDMLRGHNFLIKLVTYLTDRRESMIEGRKVGMLLMKASI